VCIYLSYIFLQLVKVREDILICIFWNSIYSCVYINHQQAEISIFTLKPNQSYANACHDIQFLRHCRPPSTSAEIFRRTCLEVPKKPQKPQIFFFGWVKTQYKISELYDNPVWITVTRREEKRREKNTVNIYHYTLNAIIIIKLYIILIYAVFVQLAHNIVS
jgi:hypothetical protein